jgi:PAS domain S-box-containing protein
MGQPSRNTVEESPAILEPRPQTACSSAELRDFLENAGVPFHWLAEDGVILWANRAELELMGYRAGEYIGHNIAEFHVDQPAIADILTRLKNDEKLTEYEARLRCKDGTIRHVAISSSVYRPEGKFGHSRCVTLDITAQKKVRDLQQRLCAIVESSDDAIVAKDLNGMILSWNRGAERIFGYKADEVVGQHISLLSVPNRADESPHILERLKRGERVEHYKTERRAKDGRILTVSLTVSPLFDPHGVMIGVSAVARDITVSESQAEALRLANEALTSANAELEQFVYSASHDLQEPVRMVATYSELLMRTFGDRLRPHGAEYLDYVLQGALRMEQLLKDLRTYTMVSTSHEATPEYIDAGAALRNALATLRPVISESGARIGSTDLPRVKLHEFRLEQLFQNLISNALRYRSAAPPEIRVSAEPELDSWRFAVQDNGIGIDPKYKEQIFDLFKRLHSVAEYPGTGMGLAICKRIVERARGRIWVESEPGRGSTFFFTIPGRT